MNKIGTFLIIMVMAAIVITGAGCKRSGQSNFPEWLNDFPPEDVLWGIGSAKEGSPSMSMFTAEARARAEIARQLNANVVMTYSIYDDSSKPVLKEAVQETNTDISGARIIKRWEASDGTWWVLLEYRKPSTSILDNEQAALSQFRAQQALNILEAQLAKPENSLSVDE